MGVVCVLHYPLPAGKSGPQVVNALQKRVELLGAVRTSNFAVECSTYQHVQGVAAMQRTINLVTNSETPASCYSVLDSGSCLVTDTMFERIMPLLREYYEHKENLKMESRGQRYEYCDFIIKIGSVVLGQSSTFKGVLVEIEYSPCSVAADCMGIMKEIALGLLDNHGDQLTNHLKGKLNDIYTPVDTVLQYLEHFNSFRKAAQPSIAPR